MSTKIRTSNLHAEVIEALGGGGGGSDVTFTGLLKAKNGVISLNGETGGLYSTLLVGERPADDGYASLQLNYGNNLFSSKIDATSGTTGIWTNRNSVNGERFTVYYGDAAETVALKPLGSTRLEANVYGATATGTMNADSATINLLNITQGGGTNQMQVKNRYGAGLQIGGNWIRLMKPDFSADMGVFKPGAEVELYHNGSQKFETTSTGVDVTGDINLSGKVVGGGMVLLQETTFTSNTSSVSFDVFDESKYGHYVFYWICNHGPDWHNTHFRFRNSSGDISSTDYHNSTSWKNAVHNQSPVHNSSSYAGNQSYAWLAGNGTAYSSHGYGFISLFADGTSRALVRGISQLAYRSSTGHYEESWASTLETTNPHSNLTGFTIFGSGGNSSFGRFTVFGVERA